MNERRSIRSVAWVVVASFAASCSFQSTGCRCGEPTPIGSGGSDPEPVATVRPDAGPASADGGPPSVSRDIRSRYLTGAAEVLQALEVADPPDPASGAVVLPGFRFTWNYLDRYADAAFAMSASSSMGRAVTGHEVHEAFCAGKGRGCSLADFTKSAGGPFTISRVPSLPSGPSQTAAVAACQQGYASIVASLKSSMERGAGAVVVGFVGGGFFDLENQPTSVHAFAVHSIDADGVIYLRDGAEPVPITYRVRRATACNFLTAPTQPDLDEVTRAGLQWSVNIYQVAGRNPVPPVPTTSDPRPPPVATTQPSPGPRPTSTPPPLDLDGGTAQRGDGPPVPCRTGSEQCDLGSYSLPASVSATQARWGHRVPGAPAEVFLRVGFDPATVSSATSWLGQFERRCGVHSVGANRFMYSSPCRSNPLHLAYAEAGDSEVTEIKRVASHFMTAMQQTGNNRRWLIESIVKLTQDIPYELIPTKESPMGLRAPLAVLQRNAGDCDSKSFLAALLLTVAGVETAVVSYDGPGEGHAVLGIADGALPEGGARVNFGGKSFVLVEATTPSAIGDMEGTRKTMQRYRIALDSPHVSPVTLRGKRP